METLEPEKRRNYPDILAEIAIIRSEQEQLLMEQERLIREIQKASILLDEHIRETQEITDLWVHSRWLINALKFIAVTATTIIAGWLAIKQFMGGTP